MMPKQLRNDAADPPSDPRLPVYSPTGELTPHFRLTAVAYLRVSTEEQADSRLGLDAQRASVTAEAARRGLTLREVHVDAGVHGDRPVAARPGLTLAVHRLRRGDVLLVAKRDRLARNILEAITLELLLAKKRGRVVSAAGEGSDDDSPSSWYMRRQMDLYAEFERLNIALRTKESLATLRATGKRAGQIPFGFHLAAGPRVHARGCQTRSLPLDACRCGGRVVQLERDVAEQAQLDHMRALQAIGRSYRQITATLNAEGVTTRKGTPVQYQWTARVLRPA